VFFVKTSCGIGYEDTFSLLLPVLEIEVGGVCRVCVFENENPLTNIVYLCEPGNVIQV
jgi:hypothetical protein